MSHPLLIFLHNLKTGGTTLRTIIARQYPPSAVHTFGGRIETPADPADLRRLDLSQTRVIQTHGPFGLHRQLDRPAVYVTMLREPVDRMISLYYFTLQDEYRAIHDEARRTLGSLEAFAAGGALLETDNGQVRRLSGLPAEFGRCTPEMLEVAKQNVREQFVLVGLSEQFDESLLLMRERFGWGPTFYLREKTTARRPRPEELPSSTRDAILEHNRLDAELYRYAEQLLEEAAVGAGAAFEDDLRAFRTLNGELGRRAADLGREGAGAFPHSPPALEILLDGYARLLARDGDLQREVVHLKRQVRQRDKELTTLRRETAALSRKLDRAKSVCGRA